MEIQLYQQQLLKEIERREKSKNSLVIPSGEGSDEGKKSEGSKKTNIEGA